MAFPDDLLDNLVGTWTLTGSMGKTRLTQTVDAEWVFNREYLRVRFKDSSEKRSSEPPYEGVYYTGYDSKRQEYVFHLLDTFGGSFSRVLGFGKRDGMGIAFAFQYPDGPFRNTFTWSPETGTWCMLLEQQTAGGEWNVFADKHLARR